MKQVLGVYAPPAQDPTQDTILVEEPNKAQHPFTGQRPTTQPAGGLITEDALFEDDTANRLWLDLLGSGGY
jgi:hypothetical protein